MQFEGPGEQIDLENHSMEESLNPHVALFIKEFTEYGWQNNWNQEKL